MRRFDISATLLVTMACLGAVAPTPAEELSETAEGRIYYVRQTVGADSNDGLSPGTAWKSISKLSDAMTAGDTAYVGPGLYRDQIIVKSSGTPTRWITFVADTTGAHTGDPPGTVLITGAEAVNEEIFQATSRPGVFSAEFRPFIVSGATEIDGPQYRYLRARDSWKHLTEDMALLDVVDTTPSSYHYDKDTGVLTIHTSDGQHPSTHEIELIHRGGGISMTDRHYVTVTGFSFRHTGDAGLKIYTGSSDVVALNNTSWGHRQGIRVYAAKNVVVHGNTLFHNDNCGVYFAKGSTNGVATNNVLYENDKGVRWSSESNDAVALGNVIFDNHERGISVENAEGARLLNNTIVNNKLSQILAVKSRYVSEGNCIDRGSGTLTAELSYFKKYASLDEYRLAELIDLSSREGDCVLPDRVDVHRIHAETMAYAETARALLAERDAVEQASNQDPAEATDESSRKTRKRKDRKNKKKKKPSR